MNEGTGTPKLAAALAKAQAVMPPARKNAKNTHLKNSYADLAACWDACRQPLTDHGLSVVQMTEEVGDRLYLITSLMHDSGEAISCRLPVIFGDAKGLTPMQAMGSALSYARRYGLCGLVGIATEDDDGTSTGVGSKAQAGGYAPAAAPVAPAPPAPISGAGHRRLEAEIKNRKLYRDYAREWFALHGVKPGEDGQIHLNQVPGEHAAALVGRLDTWRDAEDLIAEAGIDRGKVLDYLEEKKGRPVHLADLGEAGLAKLVTAVGQWKEDPAWLAKETLTTTSGAGAGAGNGAPEGAPF